MLGAYALAKKSAVKHIRILFKKLVVNIIKVGVCAFFFFADVFTWVRGLEALRT